MAFLLYFVVVLVSAATVMFGLDLATSPLSSPPNVPIGRTAHVTSTPTARHAARAKRAVEAAARTADDSKLSPVYPASPKVPKPQLAQQATDGAVPKPPKQSSNDTWLPPAPQHEVASAPKKPPESQQATSSPPPQDQQTARQPLTDGQPSTATHAPAAQPAAVTAQEAPAQCDVQACGAAYRSFRASDCTYQPYQGPRRACTKSGATVAAAVPRYRRRSDWTPRPYYRRPQPYYGPRRAYGDEDEEIAHIVRHMAPGARGDIAVRDSQGRVIIVRPEGARAFSPFDNDDYGD